MSSNTDHYKHLFDIEYQDDPLNEIDLENQRIRLQNAFNEKVRSDSKEYDPKFTNLAMALIFIETIRSHENSELYKMRNEDYQKILNNRRAISEKHFLRHIQLTLRNEIMISESELFHMLFSQHISNIVCKMCGALHTSTNRTLCVMEAEDHFPHMINNLNYNF